MGFYNRPYLRNDTDRRPGGYDDGRQVGLGGVQLALPRPTWMTVALMVACAGVYLAGAFEAARVEIDRWLPFYPPLAEQVWRLATFQFVHADARHLMWNMLGLYFFGPPLERLWGRGRFLAFYLACGAFGAVSFWILSAAWDWPGYLMGASGGILGCVMGCAILFPGMLIIVFPIRWVAAFYAVLYVFSMAVDRNLSDAAHLGGMVAAAAWIVGAPAVRRRMPASRAGGSWERRLARKRKREETIDRILDKIRRDGLGSLSWWEKRRLRRATRRQQAEDRAQASKQGWSGKMLD